MQIVHLKYSVVTSNELLFILWRKKYGRTEALDGLDNVASS